MCIEMCLKKHELKKSAIRRTEICDRKTTTQKKRFVMDGLEGICIEITFFMKLMIL